MTEKSVGILANRAGNGMPLAAAITLVLLMFILVISEYARLMIISAGVKDAMGEAIISTVNDNYADVYHAVREGYAAGYQPANGSFEESVNYGDIYGRLDNLLGLRESEGYHYSITSDGKAEFRVSGLQVEVKNVSLASGIQNGYEAAANIQLEVPVRFLNKALPNMKITLRMKAAYTPKF